MLSVPTRTSFKYHSKDAYRELDDPDIIVKIIVSAEIVLPLIIIDIYLYYFYIIGKGINAGFEQL